MKINGEFKEGLKYGFGFTLPFLILFSIIGILVFIVEVGKTPEIKKDNARVEVCTQVCKDNNQSYFDHEIEKLNGLTCACVYQCKGGVCKQRIYKGITIKYDEYSSCQLEGWDDCYIRSLT